MQQFRHPQSLHPRDAYPPQRPLTSVFPVSLRGSNVVIFDLFVVMIRPRHRKRVPSAHNELEHCVPMPSAHNALEHCMPMPSAHNALEHCKPMHASMYASPVPQKPRATGLLSLVRLPPGSLAWASVSDTKGGEDKSLDVQRLPTSMNT